MPQNDSQLKRHERRQQEAVAEKVETRQERYKVQDMGSNVTCHLQSKANSDASATSQSRMPPTVGPSNTAELPDRRPLLAWRYQFLRHQDMVLASTSDCRSGTVRRKRMGQAERGECALTARDKGLALVTSSHFRVGRLTNLRWLFLVPWPCEIWGIAATSEVVSSNAPRFMASAESSGPMNVIFDAPAI